MGCAKGYHLRPLILLFYALVSYLVAVLKYLEKEKKKQSKGEQAQFEEPVHDGGEGVGQRFEAGGHTAFTLKTQSGAMLSQLSHLYSSPGNDATHF